MDGLKHKSWCLPAARTTEVISPVVGHRCRNCKAEKDKYKEMISLLSHCKLFILTGKGYSATRYDEIELLRKEFEKVGII